MIKLIDILNEIDCWDGYKPGDPKTKISSKTGKRVNNCVPIKEDDELEKFGIKFFNYIPHSFAPDLNSLNKEEHSLVMNDLRKERMGLIDYLQFVKSMFDNPIYKSIFSKLIKSNKDKIDFALDQNEIFDYNGPVKLQKFKNFYEKYKDRFPNWALENKRLYIDTIDALKSSLNEHEGEEYPPYMYSPVGFSCAVCKYYYVEWENRIQGKNMCSNKQYQEYKGTAELVDDNGSPIKDPSKWCSNWFIPKGE